MLVACFGLMGLHAEAQQVTNNNNTGPGSLRAAISNAASGAVITFDASLDGQALQLGGSQLLINKELTIDASNLPNRFIIDGQSMSRCVGISAPGTNVTVCLKHVVIQNGNANANTTAENIFFGGVEDGSGILCTENLELHDSDIFDNRGEAVKVTGPNTTILRCRFIGNRTFFFNDGGALLIRGNAIVRDSTFADNTSSGCRVPAAVSCLSYFNTIPLVRFERCTFTDNENSGRESSDPNGCPFGVLVYKPSVFKVAGATLQLYHCTVVGNRSSRGPPACAIVAECSQPDTRVELEGTIINDNDSSGFDLYSDGTNCYHSLGGNWVGTGSVGRFGSSEVLIAGDPDPGNPSAVPLLLQPLGNYGGPTPTMPPLAGSPAIDAHPAGTSLVDQRGFPMFGVPDAGAAEYHPDVVDWSPPDIVYGDDFGLTHNATSSVAGTFTYANPAGSVATIVGPTNITLAFTPAPGTGLTLTQYLVTAAIDVQPAPLTVTENSETRAFGDTNPVFTATFNGLVNGDTPSMFMPLLSSPAVSTSPSGMYPIDSTLVSNANYVITLIEGTLTVTGATLFAWSPPDLVYGDDFSSTHNATSSVAGTFAYQFPATNVAVNPGLITIGLVFTPAPGSGLPLPQYTFTTPIVVHPAPLSIVVNSETRLFGEPNPVFTASFTGLVNGDTPALFPLSSPAVSTSPPGTYPIEVGPSSVSANYMISLQGTLTVANALFAEIISIEMVPLSDVVTGLPAGDRQVIPRITTTSTPTVIYQLQRSQSIDTPAWQNVTLFSGPLGTNRVSNVVSVPSGAGPLQFFRVLQTQN